MRLVPMFFMSLALAVATSCALPNRGAQEALNDERITKTVADFYESAGNSYFVIGWEYFNLAQENEKTGNKEGIKNCSTKARIYTELSKEWIDKAHQLRGGSPDLASTPPASETK